ncbi:hypothetical protein K373_05359 [Streptomyces sp. DvalAA-21]|nr:hypothetical protein SACTE_6502 [Streptomyces sp. SirexAA-E]PZX33086.1 hypothetical protein K373_05359 [Streptomyces sp. DvalAA-21]RAJ26119.1 hypothetical protein K351_06425 [Streptomyces sp. DpondAA-E10]RAJ39869.1 hypothetical protein K352_06485 [Streptomyces sp. DpondAA-A50]SCE44292.1 hypothetical protein GA0115235_119925 [Streptomyces sp. DpondAA-F4a]SCL98453.1 hypothetical protein SAMN04883147_105125 [Streptomyces sp. DpondAA-F4]
MAPRPQDASDLGDVVVRRAREPESDALVGIDAVAVEGDAHRRAGIGKWCRDGLARVAEGASGRLGYCVVEHTFLEQGFVTMLMAAPAVRGERSAVACWTRWRPPARARSCSPRPTCPTSRCSDGSYEPDGARWGCCMVWTRVTPSCSTSAAADRADAPEAVGGCVKADAADHPTVLAASDLVVAERPGVACVRTSSQEAFGGGHVAVGGVSRHPAVTAVRIARHHSLGLADGHRMKHEPRCLKIAHSREDHHEG